MPQTTITDPETTFEDLFGAADPASVVPPTQLTIHRTSPEDVKDRQVIFSLDGERITQLLYDQTFTCHITPGPHRLRANNTLVWKTAEFVAPANTHVHFTCINYAPRGMLYMLAMFGVAPLFLLLKPGRPEFVRL
jgi:hypothetical protein